MNSFHCNISTDSTQIWTRSKTADGFYTFFIQVGNSRKFLTAKGKHTLIVKGKINSQMKRHLAQSPQKDPLERPQWRIIEL